MYFESKPKSILSTLRLFEALYANTFYLNSFLTIVIVNRPDGFPYSRVCLEGLVLILTVSSVESWVCPRRNILYTSGDPY